MSADPSTTNPPDEPGAPFVSMVLPAYNEEDRLPKGIDRVIAFLAGQSFTAEIVVADDGSRDRTPDIVRDRMAALPANVSLRLLQHDRNRGKGAAIRTGVLAASGRYVFFMDADLATPVEESLKLLAQLYEVGERQAVQAWQPA